MYRTVFLHKYFIVENFEKKLLGYSYIQFAYWTGHAPYLVFLSSVRELGYLDLVEWNGIVEWTKMVEWNVDKLGFNGFALPFNDHLWIKTNFKIITQI